MALSPSFSHPRLLPGGRTGASAKLHSSVFFSVCLSLPRLAPRDRIFLLLLTFSDSWNRLGGGGRGRGQCLHRNEALPIFQRHWMNIRIRERSTFQSLKRSTFCVATSGQAQNAHHFLGSYADHQLLVRGRITHPSTQFFAPPCCTPGIKFETPHSL